MRTCIMMQKRAKTIGHDNHTSRESVGHRHTPTRARARATIDGCMWKCTPHGLAASPQSVGAEYGEPSLRARGAQCCGPLSRVSVQLAPFPLGGNRMLGPLCEGGKLLCLSHAFAPPSEGACLYYSDSPFHPPTTGGQTGASPLCSRCSCSC